MSYTVKNFKTKKQLKEAVKAGESVMVQAEFLTGEVPTGVVYLEGPHYPEQHKWYAQAVVNEQGQVVSVK